MRTFIISIFIFLSVSQVSAQLVYGPGNKPCSDLVKAWEGGGFFDKNFLIPGFQDSSAGPIEYPNNHFMRMKLFLEWNYLSSVNPSHQLKSLKESFAFMKN